MFIFEITDWFGVWGLEFAVNLQQLQTPNPKLQTFVAGSHLFHYPPPHLLSQVQLLYFYSIQNGLQQLDLFGMPLETTAREPRKKEKKTTPPAITAEPSIPMQPVVTEMQAVARIKTQQPSAKKSPGTKLAGKRGRKSFKEMDSEVDLIEIPDEEVLQQKLYYSISEVAGWFKVNTSLLRYWENEFDILQPRKTRKGDRLFRVEDIKNLQVIYYLLRQRKFSIDGAKNYLKNNKQEVDTQVKLMEALSRFKSFLLELKASL
jgi:DNA-binding transcriptional MerR regulator